MQYRTVKEESMHIITSLKDFFIHVFSGKTADPASRPNDSKAEGNAVGKRGEETRCVNPDNGCHFEMS
jgi:hypothetical protein